MVALLAALAMLATPPAPMGGGSVGKAFDGRLQNGIEMPVEGRHHRFTGVAQKKKSHYGTLEMVQLLQRAAATVSYFVDGPPMVLGSISKKHGGKMNPHKSHQAGRDVDILFYVVDAEGRRRRARGFFDFDKKGRCTHRACVGWTFDVQRNWWLIRTLVWSQRPQIQYVFVSRGLRALMLSYAEKRGEHPEILARARKVLVQPGNSSPHADHFHVRIYCSRRDKVAGCVDNGPRWQWTRHAKK
ncbi:MAG: penicillin-insensitive murein endopeptidase [Myxococcota bacterium]|jgi:penicillin-insensitive murein endopeptidase